MYFSQSVLSKSREFVKKISKDGEFSEDISSRLGKVRTIKELVSEENLRTFTRAKFVELLSNLWAMALYGNKEYIADKMIEKNGLDVIKNKLYELVYSKENIEKRFDNFNGLKHFGNAITTEILCYTNPKEYYMLNGPIRKVMAKMGVRIKNGINGKQYVEYKKYFEELLNLLDRYYEKDFLVLDYVLWEYSEEVEDEISEVDLNVDIDKDHTTHTHNQIRDYIEGIGAMLGFKSDIEVELARGCRVDDVWTAEIGNLGIIKYVFEVQSKGSIDSLILNLQKSLRNPAVQKVIAVSTEEQIEKIKREVEDLSDDFRRNIVYWTFKDVYDVYEHLSQATEKIRKLKLL